MSTTHPYILRGGSALLLCLCLVTGRAQERYDPVVLQQQLAHSQADTNRAMLYIRLGDYYLRKMGELPHDLDSAALLQGQGLALAQYLHFPEGVAEAIFLQARILRERGQHDAAAAKMDEAQRLAQQGHFRKLEGYIYMDRGFWYGNDGENFDKKLACMQQAEAIFHETGSTGDEADMLKTIAEIYQFKARHDTAAVLLNRALTLARSIHSKDVAGIYILMEENYREAGDYPMALRYAQLAVNSVEDQHDETQQLVEVYNRMAILYSAMRDFDQSLVYLKKAAQGAIRQKDTASAAILNCNIANIYNTQGNTASASALMKTTVRDLMPKGVFSGKLSVAMTCVNVFVANHEVEAARPYYEMLVKYYHEVATQKDEQVGILLPMIRYMQATGHYPDTYRMLDEYIGYYSKFGNNPQVSLAEELYFRTDSAMGHLASAIKHYQRYKTRYDARTNTAQSRLIATMRAQFDLERKDKDIQLLSKQNQLQTTSLHQEQVIRNVVLAGICMLLALLALIYNRYRTKQRSNLQLQQKQNEINAQNELLKKLLTDKEWLLREIHHRVKNNLQIVISLLNSQSAYLNNEDALNAIRNSQHRMYAMSLIHQKLYQSDNLATIDMQWYICELAGYMQASFDTGQQIRFAIDTTPLQLDVAQAVPLGLILNEAISNAIKYAFPDKRKGLINISLQPLYDGHFQLSITDNGVGLPANFNVHESQSLGMSLMRGLADQVDGTLTIIARDGLSIHITFSKREEIQTIEDAQTRA